MSMDYNYPPCSPSSSGSSGSSPSREVPLRLPSDEELRREGIDIVIQRLRHAENEHKKLLIERSRSMKDVNKKLQLHLLEVRSVREVNQRLMQEKDHLLKEKEELAGICCFLDDDREKAKKVAREWQMFGRYATGVLQKELATCHSKIKELEQRQITLTQENRNLKEICLMLDQEQAGSRSSVDSQNSFPCPPGSLLTVSGQRDSGDGSSNGSTTSNCSPDHRQGNNSTVKDVYSADPTQGESYVRYLEHRVRHLEEEAKGRVKRVNVPPPPSSNPPLHPPQGNIGPPGKLERKFFSSSVLPTTSQPNESHVYAKPPTTDRLSGSEGNLASKPESVSAASSQPVVNSPKIIELDGVKRHPYLNNIDKKGSEKKDNDMRDIRNVVWRQQDDRTKIRLMNGKPHVPRTASVSNL